MLSQRLKVAEHAARKAGIILRNSRPQEIHAKKLNDMVTEIDILIENCIKSEIMKVFPNDKFLAEETATIDMQKDLNEAIWIIDPLDGTTNFIHNLNHSAISIAYKDEKELLLGCIYNPYKDEFFSASKNQGTFLNGKQIYFTEKPLKDGLIATGFPFRNHHVLSWYMNIFSKILPECQGIRRCGSAAIDLADLAFSRYQAFFEGWLSPWDIAAGVVILEEAGVVVMDFDGEKNFLNTGCIIAGSYHHCQQILSIIKPTLGEIKYV